MSTKRRCFPHSALSFYLLAVHSLLTVPGCTEDIAVSSAIDPEPESSVPGNVEFRLSTMHEGVVYRLRYGTFAIRGTFDIDLTTETDPDATILSASLPPGPYHVQLADGWLLERQRPTGGFEGLSDARLQSENPQLVTIHSNQTTTAEFEFEIDGAIVPFPGGTLDIEIDVHEVDCNECGCGPEAEDSDRDGVPDCVDQCPHDRYKIAPGVCGCGELEEDADFDGVVSCLDCDDSDPEVRPGQVEVCDGIDNDCDGTVDGRVGLCPGASVCQNGSCRDCGTESGPLEVFGGILEDTVWCASRSPVRITGDLTVVPDITLTIGAGTIVEVDNGVDFDIRGHLEVLGSEAEPVHFGSSSPVSTRESWNGLMIETNLGGSANFEHAVFQGAKRAISVDCCWEGGPVVVRKSNFVGNESVFGGYAGWDIRVFDSQFSDNYCVMGRADIEFHRSQFFGNDSVLCGASRVSLFDCEVFDNRIGLQGGGRDSRVHRTRIENNDIGVINRDSGFELVENAIVRNRIGVVVYGQDDEPSVFVDNTICGNTEYDIELETSHPFDASDNYWCTLDEEEIDERIFDFRDDEHFELGLVEYRPILNEPHPNTPEWCSGDDCGDCEPSCEDRICGSDGCGDSCGTCDEPPEPSCLDAWTVLRHELQGICDPQGRCSYLPTMESCEVSCTDGVCDDCEPRDCSDYPDRCGTFPDGCGGTSTCGCEGDEVCNEGICQALQCAPGSGPCCDDQGSFREPDYVCNAHAVIDHGCPWGSGPGSDIGRRSQSRHCSGLSAQCDGNLGDFADWERSAVCRSDEYCEIGDENCRPLPCSPNSGPCCDGQGNFRSSNTVCEVNADLEYGCPGGTGPGSDVSVRTRSRMCSGSSSQCNGNLGSPNPWQLHAVCDATGHCEEGEATCGTVPCPATTDWDRSSDSETDASGQQHDRTIAVDIEVTVREQPVTGDLQVQVCKGSGTFSQDVWFGVHDGADGNASFGSSIATRDLECSDWIELADRDDYAPQDWFGGVWKLVSPASSIGDWPGGNSTCAVAGTPGGTCWNGTSLSLRRTCRP